MTTTRIIGASEELEERAEVGVSSEPARLSELHAPAPADLAVSEGAARALHEAVLQAFTAFSDGYHESPPDAENPRTTDLKEEATVSLGRMLQDATSPAELSLALNSLLGGSKSLSELAAFFDRLSVVTDFQERVRKGFTIGDGALPHLDYRNESYAMVLRSLAAGHELDEPAREALCRVFTGHCDAIVASRQRELEKLAERAEIEADEQLVEGAGKNLRDLLEEKLEEAKQAASSGARVVGAVLALPFAAGFALAGGLLSQLQRSAEGLLARLGLFERMNDLRDAVSEREESESSWLANLRLNLQLFSLKGIGARFGGGLGEEDEPAIGMKGAARRKSQLGIKPLHSGDDASYDQGGGGELGVDNLLGSLRQRNFVTSKIRSHDGMFSEVLHNTDAWVVERKDGSLTRLDVFLERASRTRTSEDAPTFKELYPEVKVPASAFSAEYGSSIEWGETEVTARIYPGMTLTLPLSPGYAVRKLAFIDRNGQVIEPPDGHWNVRQGLFGSFMVKSPVNAKHIAFVVSRRSEEEASISPELRRKLKDLLPVHKTYHDPEKQVFKKALEALPNVEDRADLWYLAERKAGFIYTMDPFLSRYQKRAGTARPEAIAGTRMGICDSFAFYVAVELRSLGSPALVVSGPVIKEGQFQFNPGHAVAAVASASGVKELDLTRHADGDGTVSRWNLNWSDRREMVGRLRAGDLTNRSVYETAEELHYRLRGEVPPWSDMEAPGELGAIGRLLKNADQKGASRVRERPRLADPMNEYELSPRLKAELKGVEALTQKWYIAELFEQGRTEGSLKPLYRYFAERGSRSGPEPSHLTHLPAGFEDLKGFNGLDEICSRTVQALKDGTFSMEARADAARWAIEATSISKERREREGTTYSYWPLDISPRQVAGFYAKEILSSLPEDSFRALFDNLMETLKTSARCQPRSDEWDRWSAGGDLAVKDGAQIRALIKACHECVGQLDDRAVSVPVERAYSIAETVFEAVYASYPCTNEEQRKALGALTRSMIDTLERRADLAEGQLAIMYMRERGHGGAALLRLFDRDFGGNLLKDRDVSGAILAELRRTNFTAGGWEPLAVWSEMLGMRADLSVHAAETSPALVAAARGRLAGTADEVGLAMGWPGPARPASELAGMLSHSAHATLWRSLRSLEQIGGLRSDEIAAVWPRVSEAEIGARILASLELDTRNDPVLHLQGQGQIRHYSPRFGDLTALHREILRTREGAEPVLAMAALRSPPVARADLLLYRIRDEHPSAWQVLSGRLGNPLWDGSNHPARDMLAGSSVEAVTGRLFEGISKVERYHAALWLGCRRIAQGPLPSSGQARILPISPEQLSELLEAAPLGEERISSALESFGFDADLSGPLRDLSPRAREAALFSASLALVSEASEVRIAIGPLPYEAQSALTVVVADNGKNELVQLWAAIERRGKEEVLTAALSRAKKSVDTFTVRDIPKQSSPYSRYLLMENAPITPRSSSGNFEQLRQYRPGDPIQRIDWKASSRTDRLLVKEYKEEEYRPVKLVIDPEWLYESYDANGRPRVELNDLRLEQVFVNVLLAEREGVPIDLVIAGRGRSVEISRLDRDRSLDDAKILAEIGRAISSASCWMPDERKIYEETGAPRYNLFASGVNVPKGSLIVCGMTGANMLGSQSALASMRSEGSFVHVLRGAGPAECASPKGQEARKERIQATEKAENKRKW